MNTRNFNRKRNNEKSIYTLRGILSGLVADEELNNMELLFLDLWLKEESKLKKNGDILDLTDMLADILADGIIDADEKEDLLSQIDCVLKYGEPESDENEKCINELTGILKGIACDDKITPKEFEYLDSWLQEHSHLVDVWPVNLLTKRVEEIKEDGIVTTEEREHLLETLKKITGTRFSEDGSVSGNVAEVWFDDIKEFDHQNKKICFTGIFLSGTREYCETLAKSFGATTSKNVTSKVDALVLGSTASKDWRFTSHGRKIEKAMKLKSGGKEILLLSESIWQSFCTHNSLKKGNSNVL